MITQFSTKDQIIKELCEDYPKAKYWNLKQYRSDKGYHLACEERKRNALRLRKDQIGNMCDYHSRNGNRWKIVDICRYFDTGQTAEFRFAFIYWETLGSVGSIFPIFGQEENPQDALIYTSHFYQRLAERRNIKEVDANLVMAFMLQNYSMLTGITKDENGKECVDVRVQSGICRGYRRSDEIIEVRTYLNDVQLSNKQLRDTKLLRNSSQYVDTRPLELQVEGILNSKNGLEETFRLFENKYRAAGAPKGIGSRIAELLTEIYWFYNDFLLTPTVNEVRSMTKAGEKYTPLITPILEDALYHKKSIDVLDLLAIWFDIIPDFDGNAAFRRFCIWCTHLTGRSEGWTKVFLMDVDEYLNKTTIKKGFKNEENIVSTLTGFLNLVLNKRD